MSFTQYIEYYTCKQCGTVAFRKGVKTDDYGFPIKGESYPCDECRSNDFNYELLDRCKFSCPICDKNVIFLEGIIPYISYIHEDQPFEVYWGFKVTPTGSKISVLKARIIDISTKIEEKGELL